MGREEVPLLEVRLPTGGTGEEAWRTTRRRAELRLPRLAIAESPAAPQERFSIQIRRPEGRPISWEMVPDQNAEAPFLGLLEALRDPPAPSPLAGLTPLPKVTLYAARWCSASSGALALLCPLAAAEPSLALRVVDGEDLAPEERPPALASVPWVVLGEGESRLFGTFSEGEFREALEAHLRGEGPLWTLRHLLSRKLAGEVRELLAAGVLRARDLGRLVVFPDLGTRLAATHFLSEEAGRGGLDLSEAGEALVEALLLKDPRDRGDAAYALGEMGDPRFLKALEALRADPDGEVREAAEEAAERIRMRGGPLTG
ncbi:MAG: HEAT repeat domain-containing protein [Acidobacteriota bacterium]